MERHHTYGLQRISQNQPINSTWTVSFYGYDGGGTVRTLTSSTGAITDTYDYDAFGNKITTSGTTPNNYFYRGEQWDPDLGLYYLRARYNNPLTGRFMSRDPKDGDVREPASLHKYLYGGGNPVLFVDPSGLSAEEESSVTIKLSAAALGLGEEVVVTGELAASGDGEATIVIDYVEGKISSPFRFLQALITIAQDNGGKVLYILTTSANEQLEKVATERYGFVEISGRAVGYFPLK